MFPNVSRARYATPVSRATRILRGNLRAPISRIFYPAFTPKIISHTGLEIQRARESRRLHLHFAEPAFIKLIVMDHSLAPTRDTPPILAASEARSITSLNTWMSAGVSDDAIIIVVNSPIKLVGVHKTLHTTRRK